MVGEPLQDRDIINHQIEEALQCGALDDIREIVTAVLTELSAAVALGQSNEISQCLDHFQFIASSQGHYQDDIFDRLVSIATNFQYIGDELIFRILRVFYEDFDMLNDVQKQKLFSVCLAMYPYYQKEVALFVAAELLSKFSDVLFAEKILSLVTLAPHLPRKTLIRTFELMLRDVKIERVAEIAVSGLFLLASDPSQEIKALAQESIARLIKRQLPNKS